MPFVLLLAGTIARASESPGRAERQHIILKKKGKKTSFLESLTCKSPGEWTARNAYCSQ